MPLVAAHFDISGSSFYIQKSKKISGMFNFPYVYSKGIFSNQCTEKEFNKILIEKVLSDWNISPSRCNLITSGFMDAPEVDLKTKFSIGVVDLIESSDELLPVFINDCSFITKGVLNSYVSSKDAVMDTTNRDFGDRDQTANLSVYPNMISKDLSAQASLDSRLFQRIPKNFQFESGRKIVFTGGRFSQPVVDKELDYILILEALKGHGFFEIYMDNFNAFSLFKTIQMYDRDIDIPTSEYIKSLGTFIKTGGSAECLLSTGMGNDQFIEIEENKIFVLPLNVQNPAKLSVKSSVLGTIDIRTSGGDVGLVFDTRVEDTSIYSDVKILNDCIRQFSEILKKDK